MRGVATVFLGAAGEQAGVIKSCSRTVEQSGVCILRDLAET